MFVKALTSLTLLALLSACQNQAPNFSAMPQSMPMPQFNSRLPQVQAGVGFQFNAGLQGEEVELTGIYTQSSRGAILQLRNGEQIQLSTPERKQIQQLPGIENRSQLRVRGLIVSGQANLAGLVLITGSYRRV